MILEIFAAYLAADFISGLGHWVEDTYFVPGKFKLLNERVIEPNIYHHQNPYPIVNRSYIEINLVSMLLALMGILILLGLGIKDFYYYLVFLFVSHANQTHQWGHNPKPSKIVSTIQSTGLIQSYKHHNKHHKRPYDSKYCVMTDYLNPILDYLKFWRALEWIFAKLGLSVKRGTAARRGY